MTKMFFNKLPIELIHMITNRVDCTTLQKAITEKVLPANWVIKKSCCLTDYREMLRYKHSICISLSLSTSLCYEHKIARNACCNACYILRNVLSLNDVDIYKIVEKTIHFPLNAILIMYTRDCSFPYVPFSNDLKILKYAISNNSNAHEIKFSFRRMMFLLINMCFISRPMFNETYDLLILFMRQVIANFDQSEISTLFHDSIATLGEEYDLLAIIHTYRKEEDKNIISAIEAALAADSSVPSIARINPYIRTYKYL